jgi:hypothetical protein
MLRRPVEPKLRAAIGVMDAPLRRLACGSRRSECAESEPRVDASANRIADDAPRPGIENGRQIDEAHRNGDVGDVGDPELVGSCRHHVFRQVREDRPVMVAIRRGDKTPARTHG